MGWLTTLGLRMKLLGIAIAGVLASLGYLYVRWRIAAASAASARAKAEGLEQSREAEVAIGEKRAELREKRRIVREDLQAKIAAGRRDHFEGGWGP